MAATPASVRLGILAFILLLGQAQALFAGPYQGGTISWERDTTFVSTNDVRFNVRIELTLDRNGTFVPVVGQDVSSGAFRVSLIDKTNLLFATVPFTMTVTSVNDAEHWFTAVRVMPITIAKTRLPVRIRMNECCRSDVLRDLNHNATFRLETTVPADTDPVQVSPRSLMPPRWYWLQNTAALVQLAAAVPAELTNAFEVALVTQSALARPLPGSTANPPVPLALQASGLVSWQPPTPGLHAVQFRLLARDATGAVRASIPYDVIIDVVPECRSFVIGCNTAPAFIPETPGIFNARVNELLQVPITATDFDYSDTVTVSAGPMPAGMSFNFDSANHNTSRYRLEWTPARPDLLFAATERSVCLTAQDSRGLATDGSYCVRIALDRTSGLPPAISCPAARSVRGGSVGVARITLDASLEGAAGWPMNVVWNTPSGPGTPEAVSGEDMHTWSVSGDLSVGSHVFEARAEFSTGSVRCTTTVTVTPRQAQQVTVSPVAPVTLPSDPIALSATASSGLSVTFELVSGPGSLSGDLLSFSGAGTVQLLAHQAGDEDWLPAESVGFSVAANRQAQQIVVSQVAPVTLPSDPIALSAIATSGLAVSFELVSGPGSLTGNVLSFSGTAGTIQLLAHQAGDANWLPATSVPFSVVVNAAPAPPANPNAYDVCFRNVNEHQNESVIHIRICDAVGTDLSSRDRIVAIIGLIDGQGNYHDLSHMAHLLVFQYEAPSRRYVFRVQGNVMSMGIAKVVLAVGPPWQRAEFPLTTSGTSVRRPRR